MNNHNYQDIAVTVAAAVTDETMMATFAIIIIIIMHRGPLLPVRGMVIKKHFTKLKYSVGHITTNLNQHQLDTIFIRCSWIW